jgi:glycosyltransferase involved in cell wall biosynthesis
MHASSDQAQRPAVSIILPTYNRAHLLPEALKSIRGQTFTDWELIVVDDGSTDDTPEVVAALAADIHQPVRYVYQQNRGPAGARNTGLDSARGEFVAFLDSDDVWLPHHLQDCVHGLRDNPDVDWVFTASRGVALPEGKVLWESSLYEAGLPRPVLGLRVERRGTLRVLTDPRTLKCAMRYRFDAGLQLSVFRGRVFDQLRLPEYRIGEDQVFLLQALLRGARLAYIDAVHVIYHTHAGNISLASNKTVANRVSLMQELTRGLEAVLREERLRPSEAWALRRRLAEEYFWMLGYALLWQHGRTQEALAMFRKGIRLHPWNLQYWKVYVLAALRAKLGLVKPVAP